MRAQVAGLEERRRAAEAALARILSLAEEVTARVASLRGQQESADAEKAQREAENLQITDRLAALANERTAALALTGRMTASAPGDGGSDDRGYTPEGKPAEKVLREWMNKPRWTVK
jgi:hypothetical protein